MKISDLFSEFFKQSLQLLGDLVRFVFQPRSYFPIIQDENTLQLVRRFVFYLVVFNLVGYSMLKAASHSEKSFDQFAFLGIVLLDFVSALLLVPVFMLATLFCKKSVGLRTAVSYALTFKVVYASIPILLYAFFLISENYSIAIARAISAYVFVLGYILLFPLLFSTGLRNRIPAVLTSVFGSVLTVTLVLLLLSASPVNQLALKKYHILYDPIGADVDHVLEFITHREKAKPLEFVKRYLGYPGYEVPVSVSTSGDSWRKDRDIYIAELKREDSILVQLRTSQRFNTCITLIDLKRDEIKAIFQSFYSMDVVFDIMEKMDLKNFFEQYEKDKYTFLRRPELPKELERLKALRSKMDEYLQSHLKSTSDAIKAHHRFIVEANKLQDFRIKLHRAGMLL